MTLRSVTATLLSIPFKSAFQHASAVRDATQTIWIVAESAVGMRGYGEGCPREYVTAESPASALAFVDRVSVDLPHEVGDVASLSEWVSRHRAEVDANPAAWAAVEIALLDLIGKERALPVEDLLGLARVGGKHRFTAVLGDAEPEAFEMQVARYRAAGFRSFKIKLSGDPVRDDAKVRALVAADVRPEDVRADANNLWGGAEAAIDHLRALRFPFFAIEEPLVSRDYAGMERVARALDTRIILDESMTRIEQLEELSGRDVEWIANVRVSKMGGVLRSLAFLRAASHRGVGVIVGAHVGETSLLTRAALTVSSAAGDELIAREGAFGTHLLERDVVHRPLMFGPGGVLDVDSAGVGAGYGWGLAMSADS